MVALGRSYSLGVYHRARLCETRAMPERRRHPHARSPARGARSTSPRPSAGVVAVALADHRRRRSTPTLGDAPRRPGRDRRATCADPDDPRRMPPRRRRSPRSRRSSRAGRPAAPSPFDLADRPAWDRRVLEAVAAIPWGATASYGEIARRVGAPRAARAVGGAVGRNPIGLLDPVPPGHRRGRHDRRLRRRRLGQPRGAPGDQARRCSGAKASRSPPPTG